MSAARAADRVAVAIGRGLVAGAAATAAMTVASTAEMKLRGRPPSMAPADVAAKLLGVKPEERAALRHRRAPDGGHLARRGPRTARPHRAAAERRRGRVLRHRLGARSRRWSPQRRRAPPWEWGIAETAISGAHHVVYAAAGEAAYRALRAQ